MPIWPNGIVWTGMPAEPDSGEEAGIEIWPFRALVRKPYRQRRERERGRP